MRGSDLVGRTQPGKRANVPGGASRVGSSAELGRDFGASDVVAKRDTEGVESRDLAGSDGTRLVQAAERLLKTYAEVGWQRPVHVIVFSRR